jgi:hypothetical protein
MNSDKDSCIESTHSNFELENTPCIIRETLEKGRKPMWKWRQQNLQDRGLVTRLTVEYQTCAVPQSFYQHTLSSFRIVFNNMSCSSSVTLRYILSLYLPVLSL